MFILFYFIFFSYPALSDEWPWPNNALGEEIAEQNPQKISIECKEQIEIASSQVFFDDLVNCQGNDFYCEQLSGIEYTESNSNSISLEVLEIRLKSEWPKIEIQLLGDRNCFVTAKIRMYNKEDIESALKNFFTTLNKEKKDYHYSLGFFQILETLKLPKDECELDFSDLQEQIEGLEKNTFLPAIGLIKTNLYCRNSDKITLFSSKLALKLEQERPVLVLKQNLVKDSALLPQYFSREFRYGVTSFHVTELENLQGFRALQNLQKGELLRKSAIFKPYTINQGAKITLLVKSSGLVINALAKALEKGYKGEEINVQNMSTQKNIKAIIVDEKTVEVDML